MRFTVSLIAAVCLAATGCGDSTGPGSGVAIQLMGPASARLFAVEFSPGRNGQECRMTLYAKFRPGIKPGTSASLVDLRLDFAGLHDTVIAASDTIGHAAVADALGERFEVGDSLALTIWFFSSGPFSVRPSLRFVVDGYKDTAAAATQFDCVWDERMLSGRYLLSTINDERMPVGNYEYRTVADTLEFFPDGTMTWALASVTGTATIPPQEPTEAHYGKSARRPYRIVAADSFDVDELAPSISGRLVKSGATTLRFERPAIPWQGFAGQTWRFDKEGSNPVLPEEPGLVLTPQPGPLTLHVGDRITQQIAVTSRTGVVLSGFSQLGWSGGGGNGCAHWSGGSLDHDYTPATFTITWEATCAPGYGQVEFYWSPVVTRMPRVGWEVTVQ